MAFKDEVSSLDRIATALESLSEAEGAGIPTPALTDAGKVLMVDNEGKWTLASIPSQLPAVTAAEDEGKVLTVSNEGAWVAAALPTDDTPDAQADS